jgi:D-methionine transport system substrate-binding protein
MKKSFLHTALLIATCLLFTGCAKSKPTLKVAATPVPHAEMLEFVKPDLKEKGIDLEVIVIDDYNIPNRSLANKEVDANFFQHIPFLDSQIEQFHYSIDCFAKIHIEPMGVYSKKIHSLAELEKNGVIAIPNDPTNEGRALALLHQNEVIELADPTNLQATVLDIVKNPRNLKFKEIDAAMLARVLPDVDAAVINTNFALEAGLSPLKDAIVLEGSNSPYVNILAIRSGDEDRPDLQALKDAMTTDKMRKFILDKYKGAVIPVFTSCIPSAETSK